MKWRALAAIWVLSVVVAITALRTTLQDAPRPLVTATPSQPVADGPQVAAFAIGVAAGPARPINASAEPRWGRATVTWDPERYPSNRSDWTDVPSQWELRRVADLPDIPTGVREALQRLGCSIPRYRRGTVETSVIWGEFERSGQRDLAILCARADRTSATYVFRAGDPARRLVMPQSGSSISREPRSAVERRLDPDKPLDPDMPAIVEHDAIDIGCCECCSTIFYLHGGRWFTLPGAD